MAKSGKTFYAVARGRNGARVHNAWADCEADIKGFSNALYKGFPTAAEAENYLKIHENSNVTAASRPPISASPKKPAFYAVAQGRSGAQIYSDWPSCAADVTGYKGARFKSFATREEAEDYVRANAGVGQPRNVSRMPSLPHEPAVKTESEYDNYTQRYTTRYAPAPEPQAAGPSRQQAGQRGVSGKRPMVHGVLPSAPTRKRSATEEDIDEQLLAEAEEDMDDLLPGPSRKRQPPSWGSAVSNGDTASGPMRFTAASKFNPKDTSMQVPDSALAGFASCSPFAATSVLPDALTSTALPAQNLIDVADEPPLSAEQQSVLRRVQAGESIFFTGPAGTGKSVITRAIIRALKAQHGPEAVGVTATTGIAATNIGGCTLHSWAGAGLAKEKTEKIFWQIVKGNPKTKTRWSACKALIIDEVSMLDGDLFDKFEELGRRLRGDSRPFGGIQLVITGDLFQLPPVPDAITYQGGPKKPVKFVFEAESWSQCITSITVLTEIFRQKDATFVRLLNELRLGKVTEESCAMFKSLQRKVQYTDNIEPTVLHPKRASVLEENSRRLRALKTESLKFVANDTSGHRKEDGQPCFPDAARLKQVLDSSTLVEAAMELKVNCQVMLVKNLADKTLVNGSVGKVIAFMTGEEVAASMFDVGTGDGQALDGQPAAVASFTDSASMQPGTSAAPPVLSNVNIAQAAPTEKEKLEQRGHPSERDERASIPPGRWPVVEFKGGKRMLLPPMSFSLTNADGLEEATRVQVPLILAWALTIHKAQGQTLERVKVDVGDAFEKGQVYVALSRATQLETLQVLRFEKHRVNAHPTVIEYFKRLKQM